VCKVIDYFPLYFLHLKHHPIIIIIIIVFMLTKKGMHQLAHFNELK